jgi:transposase
VKDEVMGEFVVYQPELGLASYRTAILASSGLSVEAGRRGGVLGRVAAMKKNVVTTAAMDAALTAHYGLLLGIKSPWEVKRVDLNLKGQRVDIGIEHDPDASVACPECGKKCPRYDHAPEREWRHLDMMQFMTVIHARTPRCQCPEHGVVTVPVPWAEPHGRFTVMFEAFAVAVIEAARSFVQAMEILKLDWHTIQEIVRRAVERGLLRRSTEKVTEVGMDEKSFGRGQDYVSVMTDLKGHRVLDVVKDRDTPSALRLWESLPEKQRQRVEAVAMDMSAEFAAAAAQAAPQAAIVYDKFHVSKHLNEAVDKVRREEHRRLLEDGDESLTSTKYLWLQGACPEGERALDFSELCARNLKTSRAWYHKETFAEFWTQPDAGSALKFFTKWFGAARRSKLEPVKKVALTIKDHLSGLLNYFLHPITNAISEGFNSKIQAIKADARGFRRFANYRYRILFHCGKLDLMPIVA